MDPRRIQGSRLLVNRLDVSQVSSSYFVTHNQAIDSSMSRKSPMPSLPTLPRTSLKYWNLLSTTRLTPSTIRTLCNTLPPVSIPIFQTRSELIRQTSTLSRSQEAETLVSAKSVTRMPMTLTLMPRRRPLPALPQHPQLRPPLLPPLPLPTSLLPQPSPPGVFFTTTTTTAKDQLQLPPLPLPHRPATATLTLMEVSREIDPVPDQSLIS